MLQLPSQSNTEIHRREYNGIDLVKFLCSILVFVIHIPPFQGEISDVANQINFALQHCLCRVAVPFYFVSSGFFMFEKMSIDDINIEAIKKYCFKILKLLGVWHFLLFVGGTGHLWYLNATVTSIVFLSICFYFHIEYRKLCILAAFLYGIGLLGDSYHGFTAPLTNVSLFHYIFTSYNILSSTTRNGFFMGFIFVLMGAGFSIQRNCLKSSIAFLGFVFSTLCLLIEAFSLKHYNIPNEYNMYISLLPASFFLFAFASSLQLKNRGIYRHLRSIGMLIYFIHLFINMFISVALQVFSKFLGINVLQYQFIITLSITLLLAIFIEFLSCKERFRWIRWFLS